MTAFFVCSFSAQVWNNVKILAGMHSVSSTFDDIIARIQSMAKTHSVKSIVTKLVLAATTYFI
jgi:hypothetical protein